MMELTEAINHARDVAEGRHPEIDGCSECASQHRQLADWLEELKQFKSVGLTFDQVSRVVSIVKQLAGTDYPHNFQNEPFWIVDYCYTMTNIQKLAKQFAEELTDDS